MITTKVIHHMKILSFNKLVYGNEISKTNQTQNLFVNDRICCNKSLFTNVELIIGEAD